MTGAFVGAEEALRLGLVNHVVPHAGLLPFAGRLAAEIADQPAVHEVLTIYEAGADLSLEAALALEMRHFAASAWDNDEFRARGEATTSRELDLDR